MAEVLLGAAIQHLQDKFNRRFREAESNPVTGAVAVVVLQNVADRLAALIVNLGGNPVSLALSPDVSATNDIIIAAGGATLSMDVDEDFTLVTRQLYAISPAGASQLYVLEMIADVMNPEGRTP